jgi:hypothetical protein
MMLEDLLFHPVLGDTPNGAATGWLMFISALRDDLPWLYDIGLDLHRALLTNDPGAILMARNNLRAALDATRHGRGFRMFMEDDPESHMLMRHVPEMIDHFLDRVGPHKRTKSKTKPPEGGIAEISA